MILKVGRPAILIQNNTFKKSSDEWGTQIETARSNIEKAILAVCRIELINHPLGLTQIGSGWLVAPDVIVTNSHVAQKFSCKKDNKFIFQKNIATFKTIASNVDFRGEYRTGAKEQFEVLEVLFLEPDEENKPDIAFLKIRSSNFSNGSVMPLKGNLIPLASSASIHSGMCVAIIGYPSYENKATDTLSPDEIYKVFGNIYGVKRLQPGLITAVQSHVLTHDCSTFGGNSGSVLIDLKTGDAVGLHYGGDTKGNWAIPSQVIRKQLASLDSFGST